MDRDFSIFPDDSTGDALWNMAMNGDDISRKRDVEFTVIFATEIDALKFGEVLLFNRQHVLLCDNEESADYPYEIMVTVAMIPTHKGITDYENLLQEHAVAFNGLYDGWGSFAK